MSMTLLEALELPDEYSHPTHHLCGLCGNHGLIDTRGKIHSGAGVECGVEAPCVCANGRAIKHARDKAAKKRAPRPKTFWVSWEEYSSSDPKNTPNQRIIAYWCSGYGTNYSTIVAWVHASSLDEVVAAVNKGWPSEKDRRWRFIRPCSPPFAPPGGDRFPLPDWSKKRLQAIKSKRGA